MNESEQDLLCELLSRQTILSLAVVIEDAPGLGQLPFAIRSDFGAIYVHASRLARHSRGLGNGAVYAAMIQAPRADDLDPFQRPRVTLEGEVRVVERDTPGWQGARDLYLEKLVSGAITFDLADFTLYELVVTRGRFVSGFAGAHTLTPKLLAELAARRVE